MRYGEFLLYATRDMNGFSGTTYGDEATAWNRLTVSHDTYDGHYIASLADGGSSPRVIQDLAVIAERQWREASSLPGCNVQLVE